MKNKTKITSLLFLSTFVLAGCDPTFKVEPPHRFISGEKVFDLDIEDEMPSTVDVEGLENVFTYSAADHGFIFNNEEDLPVINNQLYIADVNCDGNKDICYKYVHKTETELTEDIIIYDYANAAILDRITGIDDFTGTYIDGSYFFLIDEEQDIVLKHSLQTLLYGEDDSEEEIEHRCYDTQTKFVLNEKQKFTKENVDIPFQILNVALYFGTYNSIDDYKFTTAKKFVELPVDEEAYGFLRIDYEGTYYTSLLEKKDVKFKNETEQSIESYRVSMVTDLPSKRPCIYRVFKFKFLRTGEIRFEVSVKKRNFNFTIYTID